MIAAIDAKAVYDAITAATVKITTDKRMYVPTLAVREQLDRVRHLTRLFILKPYL